MKSTLECIPCLIRQSLEATSCSFKDEALRENAVRKVTRLIADIDFRSTPPETARDIHRLLRAESGVADPYKQIKDRFNALALKLIPRFRAVIRESADPLLDAVRLAIAGNVIDSGAKTSLSEDEVETAMNRAFETELHGDFDSFRAKVLNADSILYLTDNAGEIVFDGPLIELLPGNVTVAVRGFPVINDATIEDALTAGIDSAADIISNGSDAPGTILADCSEEFISLFHSTDLVIAKGQGNYETLSDCGRPVSFLFKVKCPVIADHTGLKPGTHAILSDN